MPGGRGLLRVLAYVPMALILISIFFTAVPLSTDSETLSYYLPITVGSLISIAIGRKCSSRRVRAAILRRGYYGKTNHRLAPKRDGYRMPAEFEPQSGVWMLWPERNDNWRDGAKPAQRAFSGRGGGHPAV